MNQSVLTGKGLLADQEEVMDQSVRLRFLSEPDMIEAGVLDMEGCLEAVEDAFELLSKGDYLMGGPSENDHGHLIWFPKEKRGENMPVAGPDRRFCAMIAYLGGDYNLCGQKWYGSNIANRDRGLPRSIHSIILNDADNVKPLAFMSGNLLSQMRTGAVPGVASKYLAKESAETVGIIGAGMIGKTTLLGISTAIQGIKKVYVYDAYRSASESFAKYAQEELGLETVIVDNVHEAVENIDIINIAASGEELPAIDTSLLKEGSLLCLTGTPNFTSDDWIKDVEIYADNWKSHKVFIDEMDYPREGVKEEILSWAPSAPVIKALHEGRFTEDKIKDLGDVVTGKVSGRTNQDDKIIFITNGLAVEDVAWGKKILDRANEKNIGQILSFWDDKQYWLK
ncbi:tyramine oxidase subunit B [Sporosarcina soli]|uniref:Tyramine oxidase subunit B n=1 Tax=Sporosarcina soli TaxID=334736 RepID=A0ABW0TFL7_9BACL